MDYKTEAQPKATAGGVPVFCAHDAIVAIEKLIPNPKNPNTHPDAQIQALGRIIRQTGWRAPITVSKRSGFIVKGHGRLAAAKLEGLTEVPVDYQNYTNEAEEYADLVADNRIAELAEIDNKLLADIFADIDTGGGSGTTLIAAESIGQKSYLMELSPQFVDTIVKRYIRTTGKTSGIRLFRKGKELGREHFERMFTE